MYHPFPPSLHLVYIVSSLCLVSLQVYFPIFPLFSVSPSVFSYIPFHVFSHSSTTTVSVSFYYYYYSFKWYVGLWRQSSSRTTPNVSTTPVNPGWSTKINKAQVCCISDHLYILREVISSVKSSVKMCLEISLTYVFFLHSFCLLSHKIISDFSL